MTSRMSEDVFTVLVTGANSGLGLSTCKRLISEFLYTRPSSQSLLLIPTTRSDAKSQQTLEALASHLDDAKGEANKKKPGSGDLYTKRVRIQPEQLDLCSLCSVRDLGRRLNGKAENHGVAKLDVIICNAGIGGWLGVNWLQAIHAILTDLVHSVTWATYKRGSVGSLTNPQIPRPEHSTATGKLDAPEDSTLGEVFCANLFGHYSLVHDLIPLLNNSGADGAKGRVIWVSSLEAHASAFKPEDFQGLTHELSYESSKRLTDVLVLTSGLRGTAPWVDGYLSAPNAKPSGDVKDAKPRMHLAHPGVCGTSIMPLPTVLTWAMIAFLYLARWLGSIWHTIDSYKGATAPVWLALASESTLDAQEASPPGEKLRAAGKWGSATDAEGNERVERTEVEGWGWSGWVGESSVRRLRGRMRGARDLTREGREEFEEVGRRCWREMERLRGLWRERLDDAGF